MAQFILCGNLIDGTGRRPMDNAFIEIEDGLIARVGSQSRMPSSKGEEIIDLRGLTVMPGLIDCHDHLYLDMGDEEAQAREDDTWTILRAAKNAREKLKVGITTVRDLGAKNYIDVMLKKAIDSGIIPGPRLLISGKVLVRTGGHGWYDSEEVDGVDEVRKGVRRQVKAGADLIKVMASGCMSTRGSDPLRQDFTEEELCVIVEEAHRLGLKVAAHAYGGQAAVAAIKAGVDSIEHGNWLSGEELALMVERGTYLVTTFSVFRAGSEEGVFPDYALVKMREASVRYPEVIKMARERGVKIAVGTDENHTAIVEELEALGGGGYSNMEAIVAVTGGAAELCGIGAILGTVEAGKYGDLIGVGGDPLSDICVLRNVQFVMKGGVVQAL